MGAPLVTPLHHYALCTQAIKNRLTSSRYFQFTHCSEASQMSFSLWEIFLLPNPISSSCLTQHVPSSEESLLTSQGQGAAAALLSPTAPCRDTFHATDSIQSRDFPKRLRALRGQFLHLLFSTSKPACMLAQYLSKQLLSEKMSLCEYRTWMETKLCERMSLFLICAH